MFTQSITTPESKFKKFDTMAANPSIEAHMPHVHPKNRKNTREQVEEI